ncbi:hypothetical protein B0T24DRAFT_342047 [Lasiosphaeria ovina]|uniref:Uncharacterized protein n=1 Tax=Lasiosphaeria ovina TaxID=92902 RepID=A0AAE0N3K6_9PEZI|nr:hypothetical protein B0T24DRAFT_342047 [Lasiosphaeria ovina]
MQLPTSQTVPPSASNATAFLKRLSMKEAGQTSIGTHPARAPKGKTSKNRVQIIATLYTATARKPATAAFAGRTRVNGSHCREPRIWIINPGGICSSFREHKSGRLL